MGLTGIRVRSDDLNTSTRRLTPPLLPLRDQKAEDRANVFVICSTPITDWYQHKDM